ncbi:MAG: xanthine dehydrogenase family protein subunit M [Dehalococcoidales bacterium]|nr:xanthine dehydrogenase family protein subunit M [Dehalococcoidales bacterium]
MITDFEYLSPQKLDEALPLLDKYEDSKIICGGQSLLIIMKQGIVAPEYMIDIKGLTELDYIKVEKNGTVRIGATTTHRSIEDSKAFKGALKVLPEMEKRLASPQTRNWGTIGGNIAHGDPAGDPAPIFLALDAVVKVASVKGERAIPMAEFYRDYFDTVMEHNEMITEIEVPAPPAKTGVAYSKFNIIDSEMATVSAAVSITLDAGGTCKDIRIALGAAAPTPIRAVKAEEFLRGKKLTEALFKEAGEIASGESSPVTDINASSEYRIELVKAMVKKVGLEAYSRAKEA